MKKLCFYINSDWYFNLHWKERALAAKENGYEVHVVCSFDDQDIMSDFIAAGLKVHNSKMSEQSLNPLVLVKDLINSFKIINNIEPDILHCITIKPCIIGGLYAKFLKKNLVMSFVGLGRVFSSGSMKYKIIRYFVSAFYRWLSAKPDIFMIFEHEKDRADLIAITGVSHEKTMVIDGAGINTDEFQYLPDPPNAMPVVLFASRLIWSKGLADLVQAKAILKKRGINFELMVAGITVKNDPDSIPLHIIEQWSDSKAIHWLGKRDDVKRLIENCNIVALPSVYAEGVPRILIEAAAVGRPSIAYNTGGCSSIILDGLTGFIVNKDINDLTAKLECLIQDKQLRNSFGYKAHLRVKSHFCSKYVIEKTLGIYQHLVK
ncbi:MAG: glycosyltransferase family 4 protein [Pantoea sp.]|uniref:glycosyltransferase family 4 protein n=1 Tax=Pantoea sp. TaxID=69393 RepID=UPI002915308E|nr:glycosyltransferase family 4 protein [Pantoea sp.]MDU6090893.1 glycosyltransferase family 4 protein [Staphylococcus lugdunensis]MDU7836858.1 glycosyltransferase family 4 protein [Pantoea sp.]